jgi:hypothetical protein
VACHGGGRDLIRLESEDKACGREGREGVAEVGSLTVRSGDERKKSFTSQNQ